MGKDRKMNDPQYPEIRVHTASHNPLALVAIVRHAMRRARLERSVIQQFSSEALASDDPQRQRLVCENWVQVGRVG